MKNKDLKKKTLKITRNKKLEWDPEYQPVFNEKLRHYQNKNYVLININIMLK